MESREKNIIIVILVLHSIILLISQLIGFSNVATFVDEYIKIMGFGNLLIAFFPILIAQIGYFIVVCLFSIVMSFAKKVNKNVKKVISFLPFLTLILNLPICLLASRIYSFNCYLFGG